ncbi:MAG: enoyl-CoA hydratase-related protein [Dehalococcoidia bacterium]
MAYETLIYEKEDNMALVTLNRPDVLNALSTKMSLEIAAVFDEIHRDAKMHAAIITGAGRAFLVGADIAEMRSLTPPEAMGFLRRVQAAILAVEKCQCPVIAAVNGLALGGGTELSLACDLRIASDKAQFGQPEINLGIIPGGGGTQRLPRVVGLTKAMEICLTGLPIDAAEAFRIGLVNRVVPAESLMDETRKLAQRLASRPQLALHRAKAAVNLSRSVDLASGLDYEIQSCVMLWYTEDRKEGMKAFLEKRQPVFTGR